jgi:hypothetical protein
MCVERHPILNSDPPVSHSSAAVGEVPGSKDFALKPPPFDAAPRFLFTGSSAASKH